ncbi:hypothetical protein D0B54_17920 [Solimonas sp. K1W22B-7]|uniref:hypothetical protein n=1 Tax=Solimonas sp. K1W22B-7 TaxID=2303331 RepID=UPI000E32DCED|nr:hypothetical protein [Solimonas sp. K1W22B-7]AXQ30438.1 hypothetical protein D0B54_17920 [Solimonas sp. K1W22B-7]
MGSKPKEPGETAEQREMAAIAAESYDDWQQRWLPLQQEFFADTMDVAPRRRQALGSAGADYAQAFGQAQQGVENRLYASGAAPGSGRYAMGLAGFANDRAQARGQGLAGVDAMIDDQYAQGLQTLIDIGRGERAQALQGLSEAANASQDRAIADAQRALGSRSAMLEAAGSVAGMAAAYGLRGSGEASTGSGRWGAKLGMDKPIG